MTDYLKSIKDFKMQQNYKIQRKEIKPGFRFKLKQFGDIGVYTVLTDEEVKNALGSEFLTFLKKKSNMVACKDEKTKLTSALSISVICEEGDSI